MPGLKNIVIAIPVYKTPELMDGIVANLTALASELDEYGCEILIIDDSPDDTECSDKIDQSVSILSARLKCGLIRNEVNLGFVQSVNRALQHARSKRFDIVLLNSDALLTPGAIREMRDVAYLDPMIGFVSPRSNNATIATLNLGVPETLEDDDSRNPNLSAFIEAFEKAKGHLERYVYVPTAVGFCLYIKNAIIEFFGDLSLDYGKGYNEENDYIMRASRCGYRAALANHAFVYHKGEASFQKDAIQKELLDKENSRLLNARYPEYTRLVQAYFSSSGHMAESFVSALSAPLPRILIDLSSLDLHFSGTSKLCLELLRRICTKAEGRAEIVALGKQAALAFHGVDKLGIKCVEPHETNLEFAAVLRIGQPFHNSVAQRNASLGASNIYVMLDTIALDCGQLFDQAVKDTWDFVCRYSDGIVYNSQFTRDQFARRFRFGEHTRHLVSHHSCNPDEYARREALSKNESGSSHILIVGNHYPHKAVEQTYRLLCGELPDEKFVVLGDGNAIENRPRDVFLNSGQLEEAVIARCYSDAKIVVFPSHYEGFGFPVLDALGAKKPVIVRSSEINRELGAAIRSANIYMFSSRKELLDLVCANPDWIDETTCDNHGWDESAAEILEFSLDLIKSQKLETGRLRMEAASHFSNSAVHLQISTNTEIYRRYLKNSLRAARIKRLILFPLAKKRRRYAKRIRELRAEIRSVDLLNSKGR